MTNKIICVILIIIAVLCIICNPIYAANTVDDVFSGADSFLNNNTTSTINTDLLHTTSNFMFNTLLAIAIIAAVAVGIIIGIQFMTASVEEKAKVKETLVPYVVSCVVIFGAFGIWKLAVIILSGWTS